MLEEEYYTSVAIVIIVMSCLSIIGGLIVILTYILLKQLRNFALKMVAYLCLSDILSNCAMLIIPPNILHSKIGQYEHSTICTVQSLLQSWGDLSSIIWSGLISVVIFLTVVKRVQVDTLRKREYIFLIIGFLLPLFVSSIPFINNSYGEDTYYCWVKSSAVNALTYKILINYAPLWLTFIVITTLNCYTTFTIKNMENIPVIQQKSMKKMLLYPYILIVTSFWASIVALMEFSNQEIPEFIQILHHLFARSLGLLNACMYGLTPVVRSKLRNSLSIHPLKPEKKNPVIEKKFQDEQIHSEGDDINSFPGNDDQFEDNYSDSSEGYYQNALTINKGSFAENNFLKTEKSQEKLHEILL